MKWTMPAFAFPAEAGTHFRPRWDMGVPLNKAHLISAPCINPQICINIHPDAVPPIHAESYHVATDKWPLQVPVYF